MDASHGDQLREKSSVCAARGTRVLLGDFCLYCVFSVILHEMHPPMKFHVHISYSFRDISLVKIFARRRLRRRRR